jgi:hypothetical protein
MRESIDVSGIEIKVVVAPDGVKCPMEDDPHRYIEQVPIAVRMTSYYRRRLQDGSLKEHPGVKAPSAEPAAQPVQGKRGKGK